MLLDAFEPDHFIFSVIDVFVYVLIFLLLVVILRLSLTLLAKEEADDSMGKSFLTTLAIMLVCAVAALSTQAQLFGYYMIIPVVLVAMLLIRLLCWVNFKQSVLVTLIFSLAATGLAAGFTFGMNQILPEDRMTLVKRVKTSWGMLDDMAGQESEAFFTKENLKTIRLGWTMQGEALKSAVILLKDPKALDRMVADHQDALRALDLIVDGETNSVEQLAELGIVYGEDDPAKHGMELLQQAGAKQEYTEQDVQDVGAFLQSVRKDGPEVTATDAAVVIHEAMKRALTYQTNTIAGVQLGDLAAKFGTTTTAESAVSVSTNTGPAGAIGFRAAPDVYDPFAELSADERKAWMNSKTALVVTAVVHYNNGEIMAKVNNELIRVGEITFAQVDKRHFPWRLVDASMESVTWEPIVRKKPK